MSFWYDPSRALEGEPMTRIGTSDAFVELDEEAAGAALVAGRRESVMDML